MSDRVLAPPLSPAASGAIAVDLATGQVLFTRHPDSALAPASNEKLPVTFAALPTGRPLSGHQSQSNPPRRQMYA